MSFIAKIDGQVAGFVAATHFPHGGAHGDGRIGGERPTARQLKLQALEADLRDNVATKIEKGVGRGSGNGERVRQVV